MKVALIHDHLAQDGGAEKVLKILADMFPEAPIYTLLYDPKNANKYYQGRRIEASIIQKLPGGIKHYQWYLPFMPLAVEFFDLSGYDVVISDTSSFAKGVITRPETLHICYCHTPTRYLWSDTHQYINELKYNKWFKKLISLSLKRLRIWDRLAADRVDLFLANSETVRRRIRKYYRRESTVIYPPVETERFKIASGAGDYFLAGCRLAPYKRVDLIIQAFRDLNQGLKSGDKPYRLKVFGDGVDLPRLQHLAGGDSNIEFLGRVSDEERADLYSHSLAFINPQEEDFGITAVESMAAGRPVIALHKGGATETIVSGKTGLFFTEQSVKSLKDCVQEFYTKTKSGEFKWDSKIIREQAEKFSVARFKESFLAFLDKSLEEFRK